VVKICQIILFCFKHYNSSTLYNCCQKISKICFASLHYLSNKIHPQLEYIPSSTRPGKRTTSASSATTVTTRPPVHDQAHRLRPPRRVRLRGQHNLISDLAQSPTLACRRQPPTRSPSARRPAWTSRSRPVSSSSPGASGS
jgi:hypothetical protein